MTTQTTAPTSAQTAIDATELRVLLTGPDAPRVIDVRTPAEFESAHIPGSWNVPLDLLREHRTDLADHLEPGSQETVLVCRSGPAPRGPSRHWRPPASPACGSWPAA